MKQGLPFWTIFPMGGGALLVLVVLVVLVVRGCSAQEMPASTATVIPTNTLLPTATVVLANTPAPTATAVPTTTSIPTPTATSIPLPEWTGFCWDLYQLANPADNDDQNWLSWTCATLSGESFGILPYIGESWITAQSYGVYLNGSYLPEGNSVDIERCPWDPEGWCIWLK